MSDVKQNTHLDALLQEEFDEYLKQLSQVFLSLAQGDFSAKIPKRERGSPFTPLTFLINESISELKNVFKGLDLSEKRFRTLIENSPFCIHEIDINQKIVSMNPAGLKMAGVKDENNICGRSYLDFIDDENKELVQELLSNAFRGKAARFNFKAIGKKRTYYYTSCFIPIKSDEDKDFKKIMGITQDITLETISQLELKTSSAHLAGIFSSISDMLVILDANGNIQTINKRVTELLEFQEKELLGKNIVTILAGEEAPFLAEFTKFKNLIQGGSVKDVSLYSITKAKKKIPVLVTGSVMRDDTGNIINIILAASDARDSDLVKELRISQAQLVQSAKAEKQSYGETKRQKHKLERSNIAFLNIMKDLREEKCKLAESYKEQLKLQAQASHSSKLASIGELAAGVGHEINNPLAIAIGNLSKIKKVLKKQGVTNKLLDKAFDRQEDSFERIKNIVDGLRTYARVETDHIETIETHELVERTVRLVGEIYKKEGIAVITILDAKQTQVAGNIGKFQQVLMNLLSNSRDAVEDRKNSHITIATENHGDTIILKVRDNGKGMSSIVRKKIFDAFFTTKPAGKGTGMGMGIIAKIISEMKGKIDVESGINAGATFKITLPLVSEKIVSQQQEQQQQRRRLSGLALVVDDEEEIRELLREYLEDLGLRVEEADDGAIALEKVKETKYDYILTDIKMPKLTGDKFIEQAKQLQNGDARYFILTGGVSIEKRAYLGDMIDGQIFKPFTEESIYEELSKHLKS